MTDYYQDNLPSGDAESNPDLRDLNHLSDLEKQQLKHKADALQKEIADAVAGRKREAAEVTLAQKCAEFEEIHGHRPTPWNIENMKREMRAGGTIIW